MTRKHDMVLFGLTVLTCAVGPSLIASQRQRPDITVVRDRVAQYVQHFANRFSNVVTEERYVQEVSGRVTPGRFTAAGQRRDLKADFLLVQAEDSSAWMPFRDVFEVDGVLVRNRNERLTTLFLDKPWNSAIEQLTGIAAESARYNLGPVTRTTNHPVLGLAILQAQHLPQFSCTLEQPDADSGAAVWIIGCTEIGRPTFLRGEKDRDLPLRGRFSIDVETGYVASTDVRAENGQFTARITTSFRYDADFQVGVPIRMTEEYSLQDGRKIRATATYGRFRRFEVNTTGTIQPR
jgi:hypothetical protein